MHYFFIVERQCGKQQALELEDQFQTAVTVKGIQSGHFNILIWLFSYIYNGNDHNIHLTGSLQDQIRECPLKMINLHKNVYYYYCYYCLLLLLLLFLVCMYFSTSIRGTSFQKGSVELFFTLNFSVVISLNKNQNKTKCISKFLPKEKLGGLW